MKRNWNIAFQTDRILDATQTEIGNIILTLLIGAYSSKKLTVVYLEASKSVDVEKNNLVAVWIQPTLQRFLKVEYHHCICTIWSNMFKYQLAEVMILQLVSLEMGRTAPLAAITVCQNEHLQALHILNSHEIIALNNILYTFAFCLSEPNFKTVSKDRFEIATCEFQFNPNIRA